MQTKIRQSRIMSSAHLFSIRLQRRGSCPFLLLLLLLLLPFVQLIKAQ